MVKKFENCVLIVESKSFKDKDTGDIVDYYDAVLTINGRKVNIAPKRTSKDLFADIVSAK